MKRTADTDQRHMRWSLGCAHLELAGAQLDPAAVGLRNSLVPMTYRFASRRSAAV